MFSLPSLPEPSGEACARAEVELLRALGSRVRVGDEVSDDYLSDDSNIIGKRPVAVVLVESESDIEAALRISKETCVPIVPRAGGSGRTGGAVPVTRGIVLATMGMAARWDLDVREGSLVVGPGARLSEVHALVEREGWFYPPDPNSAELCCIAGNVAENAAGPRAYKYGATRDYVLGLDVFLMGGQKVVAGRQTRKGVTGYDIVSLLVGSEGTLGVFGNIRLKLIPKPEGVITLLAAFPTLSQAARAVERIVESRCPARCLEFLDEKTVRIMREGGNPIPNGAEALLLIEVDGGETELEKQAELIGNHCIDTGAIDVSVALLAEQRKKLWDTRKQMSRAVRKRALHKISEDVVVPRTQLLALIEEVRRLGETYHIDTLCYGHAGDGNLHVNFLWNHEDEEVRVAQGIADLFRCTVRLGGTLSGEHGIGLVKAPFLPLEQDEPLLRLGRQIKATFDPLGLLNPGKIFPTEGAPHGHGSC
jgi:glycolate oxidase